MMNSRWVVDGDNKLHEQRQPSFPQQPAVVRAMAQLVSYVFHPVFIPVMVIWFFLYVHPYLFAGLPAPQKFRVLIMSVVSFTLFPLVTVLLLKGLKFIETIYLKTQRDRVIPFIACMIWYFWIWYVWNNFGKTDNGNDIPRMVVQFAFATFLSTIFGLMINIRIKISLHMIAAGIVLMLFLLMAFTQALNFGIWLAIVFFLTGLIATARFIVSDHTATEVYGGLFTGMVSMLLAWLVI